MDLQKNLVYMIVHDLRCPASQIQHTAVNSLDALDCLQALVEELS